MSQVEQLDAGVRVFWKEEGEILEFYSDKYILQFDTNTFLGSPEGYLGLSVL